MSQNKSFSQTISVFHGRKAPEEGIIAGYAAIIEAYTLPVPLPHQMALISTKNRRYANDSWQVFTPRHQPEDTLYKQLTFALKYEGINLLVFKKLFEVVPATEITKIVQSETLGQYSRRIWFLYEWLLDVPLPIPDLDRGNMTPLVEEKIQYAIQGERSVRHKIINNLPGTRDFCPLIYKTPKIEDYINANLSDQKDIYLKDIHTDILQRASAFLLLKDSKASFTIEGESPKSKRASRWGQAIGQAGMHPLSVAELLRLQQIVIENSRFVHMGFRSQGGFVGDHDRVTGEPIPDHISAKWQDVPQLTDGLLATNDLLKASDYNPVLAAASIAFGFVFIHPFVDGNGRLHRYMIHHILANKRFYQQGIIFPVSASILDHLDDYRNTLESYSHPLLDFIEWKETKDHNIEVLNETIDYYRYFDATKQTEFLFDCIDDTVKNIIPREVSYLKRYDQFKRYLDNEFEMPDKTVAVLVRFLEQNDGTLSNRARSKEFAALTDPEVKEIQTNYLEIFGQS